MYNKEEIPFASVLEALFEDENPPIHLIYRLSDMETGDFEHFKRSWPAVNEDRRGVLARHMADIAEEDYMVDFSPVFDYLFTDESARVRHAALDGVWDSEDPSLIAAILAMLQNDADAGVRAAAARSLAHYILMAEWGQIDPKAAEPAIVALMAEYEKPGATLDVRRAALEAMAPAPHPRIPELINEAYEDGPDELQLSAIFAMGNSADERWLPILMAELTSPSPDFRAEAARACGMIGNSDAIDALEELVDDNDSEVGMAAVFALGQIGGERVVDLFTQLADDPDYEEFHDVIDEALEELEWRDNALDMLARIDDDDDFDLLDDLISDDPLLN